MSLLTTYLSAMFPVLFCAALGYVLARRTEWLDSDTLPTLVTHIGLPALILDSVLRMETPLTELGDTLSGILLVLALSALLGALLLHLMRLPISGYLPTLVNPNAGNLGIPLIFAILGPDALVHAVLISTVVQISHFTLGAALLSGSFTLKTFLKNSSIIALLTGAAWKVSELPQPDAVMTTLDMLAGLALPIMLLLLGKSIASIDARQLNRLGRILTLSVGRIALGGISALLVISLLPMPLIVQQTLVLQAIMPAAVLSYLLASHYNGPKDDIAAVILVSTPLALVAVFGVQWLFN